jgi:hypothetical protein
MTRTLSTTYENLFEDLLAAVVTHVDGLRQRPLSAFWPVCGGRYDGGLMVIGRAVNGWRECDVAQLAAPDGRRSALQEIRAESEPTDTSDPMRRVIDQAGARKKYNTNRAAFWRVTRQATLAALNVDPGEWSSFVCWSNLYKLAPAGGGNPSDALARAQLPVAADMIHPEVTEFAPTRVLVLAGMSWFRPFAEVLRLAVEPRHGFVEAVGKDSARRWVIARHPMRKPEQPFVQEVLSAFAET